MHFKPITLASKETIQRYTLQGKGMNCDLSFSNMFSWRFLYDTLFAEEDGFIFCRFHTRNHLAYMLPVGQGNLKAAVGKIMEDAKQQGHPFLMLGVCGETREKVEEYYPGMFSIEYDRDYCDYIYARDLLTDLKGKKLQAKRNHVHKFWRLYPEAKFKSLEEQDIPSCMEMAEEWYKNHSYAENIENEHESLRQCMGHFDELGLQGGVLYVHDKVAAFTFGNPINQDTFDVCVEKADDSYEGSYAVINNEFVKSLPAQYTYINREEDMGMEGLRRAKLSYQPTILLPKYVFKEMNPLTHLPALTLRDRCKILWQLCFNDDPAFIDLYFRLRYKDEITHHLEERGRVISALQAIPYGLTWCGQTVSTGYISGACTHPAYRGRGLMHQLLQQTHRKLKDKGVLFATLIPATPSLFDYYKKSGYTAAFSYRKEKWTPQPSIDTEEIEVRSCDLKEEMQQPSEVYRYINKKCASRPHTVQHCYEDYQVIVADMRLEHCTLLSAYRKEECVGVAFCVPQDGGVWVEDLFANDKRVKEALCKAASGKDNLAVTLKLPVAPENSNEGVLLGQARVLDAERALNSWCETHPAFFEEHETWTIQVEGDDAIAENNAFFRLSPAGCLRIERGEVGGEANQTLTIDKLTKFLFKGCHSFMSLMLD